MTPRNISFFLSGVGYAFASLVFYYYPWLMIVSILVSVCVVAAVHSGYVAEQGAGWLTLDKALFPSFVVWGAGLAQLAFTMAPPVLFVGLSLLFLVLLSVGWEKLKPKEPPII